MLGRASAAASNALAGVAALTTSLVATTAAAAHTVAACGGLLARIDVLRCLGRQRIGIELHFRLRELSFFPWLRGVERAAGQCECGNGNERAYPRPR